MADQNPATHLYATLLATLKERIRTARFRAAVAVNQELVMLYWGIGKEILTRQSAEGWGSKVIERLAKDLRSEFPEMQGLSPRNLKYMRAFAEAWPVEAIVQQAVALLPWGHNVRLLDLVKDGEERFWYADQAIRQGWSRNVLVMQIEQRIHRRFVPFEQLQTPRIAFVFGISRRGIERQFDLGLRGVDPFELLERERPQVMSFGRLVSDTLRQLVDRLLRPSELQ